MQGIKVAITGFAIPCARPLQGQGHDIRCIRGLHICWRCGKYAIKTLFGQGLKTACPGKAKSKDSAKALEMVRKDDQLPYAVARSLNNVWPDGTASRANATKRRARSKLGKIPAAKRTKHTTHGGASSSNEPLPPKRGN